MTNNSNQYIVRGVEYNTIVDACRSVPVSRVAVNQYCSKNNCSRQEALNYYIGKTDNPETYVIHGVEYLNRYDACEAISTSYTTVLRYCKRTNCSFQDALNYYIGKSDSLIEYNVRGVRYSKLSDACKAIPININTVYLYTRRTGCSFQATLNYYINKLDNGIKYDVRGVRYNSLRDACKAVPISETSVYFYSRSNNCSYQDAINYYVNKLDSQLSNFCSLYTGRDNKVYFKARCKECGKWIIVSEDEVLDYQHSDIECLRREV